MSENNNHASKVLNNDWLLEYYKKREVIWSEIIQLNSSHYIMKHIIEFPFNLFPHKDNNFWDCTFFSMYQSCVLNITKLCIDQKSDVLTLDKFKSSILKNIINKIDSEKIINKCGILNFHKEFKNYHAYLKDERNLRIAHLNSSINTNLSDADIKRRQIIINNLNIIINLINDYFKILCLGSGYSATYLEYSESIITISNNQKDGRSDIEQLLDSIAKNSYLLNLPEKEPDFWPYYKEHNLSSNDLIVLNSYRNKFGLPQV